MLVSARTFKFILLAASFCLVAIDGVAQTTAHDFCNRGVAKQKKGDLDGALADYSQAIELNPHDSSPYNNRALTKMAKGDLDGALADYDRALQISPRNFEIRDNRGVARQQKGDLDGALADYDIAIKLYKKYAVAYGNRASVKIALKDLDGALADCNRALDLNWKNAAFYNTRALIEMAKGDPTAATTDFDQAAKFDPKYARSSPPPVINKKAPSAGGNEDHSTEIKDAFAKTTDLPGQNKTDIARSTSDYAPPVEVEPKNIAAAYDRDVAKRTSEAHSVVADHPPAAKLPPKTVDVPDSSQAVKNPRVAAADSSPTVEVPTKNSVTSDKVDLGKANTGNLGGEGADTSHATELKRSIPSTELPSNAQKRELTGPSPVPEKAELAKPNLPKEADSSKQTKTDFNVAMANHTSASGSKNLEPTNVAKPRDNLSGGSSDSKPVARPDPTTALEFDNRAQYKRAIGDLDGALADYNRAIELDVKDAAAYNGRGNIKRAMHDLEGALADYNHAIELNGDKALAYYNRGITKQTQGDLDGAVADFNPAIKLDPNNAAAYHSRAAAKAMKGDLNGALADYNRAIELDPKDPPSYNNRGNLFFSEHNWRAALADYDRCFELSKEGQDYPRIYVWLIHARTGETEMADKELTAYLQQRGNIPDWFSIVALNLLGQLSNEDLLSAAKSPDKQKESGQLCEAWFYIGMKKLIAGDKSAARDSFIKSVATDRKDYTEYHFARAELQRLQK